jgi:hypothetical protein
MDGRYIVRMVRYRRIKLVGVTERTGETINAHNILVSKPQGRHTKTWENNIKMES